MVHCWRRIDRGDRETFFLFSMLPSGRRGRARHAMGCGAAAPFCDTQSKGWWRHWWWRREARCAIPNAHRRGRASTWSITTALHGTRSSTRGSLCRWQPPSGALPAPSRVTRGKGGRHGRGWSTASGLDDRGGGTGGEDGPRVVAHGRWGAAWTAVAGRRSRQ